MTHFERIIILTGAGVSAESGLDTFRDKGGIWEKYDLTQVATPEAFARDPDMVHEFYNLRRSAVKSVNPNAAHLALARLERDYPGEVLLVTQNVDDLHEKAGSRHLCHMHGELGKVRCTSCREVMDWWDDLTTEAICPLCGKSGRLRPHIVWFGEMPFDLNKIGQFIETADLFISIGTSGTVYPAAGFVQAAMDAGAHTVELNREPSDGFSLFDETHYGPATEVVPQYVEKLLSEAHHETG
ncbi:NAD-dependent deacylase [Emcibacter nanhaiensis]|uniref:NAD-dependent protein deacylase n=1 Tax=Emcibacter nanhaiensis TaxID=1505037 RepID=A0A501PBE0_9PROT|nr:NAD-dependent deacylase [Emcibacter nanhaiensis]TPD57357.1 NAD-dependent deacylase [Emcibacter nanhaiensis]